MKKIIIAVLRGCALAATLAAMLGCNDAPMQSNAGTLSLSLRLTTNTARVALPKVLNSSAAVAVDSIRLARVRVVLSKIELEADQDSAEFRSAPIVLELDVTGAMQTIGVMGVPFGTYTGVEFKIHRVDSTDLALVSPVEQARFVDFLQKPRASVIAEGLAYTNGVGQRFVYRSDLNAEQEYDLNPALTVSMVNATVNLTINVDSSNWFKNRAGALLDPNDTNNRNQIANNIKASFKVYEDDDRDGDDDGHNGDDDDDGDGGGD